MASRLNRRYGRLVVRRIEGIFLWCDCDCGTKSVKVRGCNIGKGTLSCGCKKKEKTLTHRLGIDFTSKNSEYAIWRSIIARCYNKKRKDYHRYGGRGVRVCKRWFHSFVEFYNDMGERPSKLHSLERKHNDKSYNRKNCQWATAKEQARNRKNNTTITHKKETKTLAEWSEITGIGGNTIMYRINKGWKVAKALTQKPRGA